MKESDLYPPVRDWLRQRGYTVHVEIFDCDVVGINEDGHMVAVELKLGMTADLAMQLTVRSTWADEVWGAVPPTAAKPFSSFRYHGWGLLIVKGGRIKVQRTAKPQPWFWYRSRRYKRGRLRSSPPARDCDVAGVPCNGALRQQRIAQAADFAAETIAVTADERLRQL